MRVGSALSGCLRHCRKTCFEINNQVSRVFQSDVEANQWATLPGRYATKRADPGGKDQAFIAAPGIADAKISTPLAKGGDLFGGGTLFLGVGSKFE